MAKVLVQMGFLHSPSEIVEMYELDPAPTALIAACAVLREIPSAQPSGPAARNLTSLTLPGDFHGALITDIRDFLKLRFRASGVRLTVDEVQSLEQKIGPATQDRSPGYLVNFVIGALDCISRDREGIIKLEEAMYSLADLLSEASERVESTN